MFLKNSILILFILLIVSCQPKEKFNPIIFDNSQLEKFFISSKKIIVNDSYKPIFSKNNIENQLRVSPIVRLKSWINNNISQIGNENTLKINILDASISRIEIENKDAKKYEGKNIYSYKISYLLEYELYDNSDILISNTIVESIRSTTSNKYVSLNELEIITDEIVLLALKELVKESKVQLKKYMGGYILD